MLIWDGAALFLCWHRGQREHTGGICSLVLWQFVSSAWQHRWQWAGLKRHTHAHTQCSLKCESLSIASLPAFSFKSAAHSWHVWRRLSSRQRPAPSLHSSWPFFSFATVSHFLSALWQEWIWVGHVGSSTVLALNIKDKVGSQVVQQNWNVFKWIHKWSEGSGEGSLFLNRDSTVDRCTSPHSHSLRGSTLENKKTVSCRPYCADLLLARWTVHTLSHHFHTAHTKPRKNSCFTAAILLRRSPVDMWASSESNQGSVQNTPH